MEPTTDHLESLAAKLNSLDLDASERTLLGELLASDDVEGFAQGVTIDIQGFNIGMPPSFIPTGETAMKSGAKKTTARRR